MRRKEEKSLQDESEDSNLNLIYYESLLLKEGVRKERKEQNISY